MSYTQIGNIASGILQYQFDYITGTEEQSIELNLISGSLNGLVGDLNNLLNQNFDVLSGEVFPKLQNVEISILEDLYLRDYNNKQASKLLRGVYTTDTAESIGGESDWIEISEGDTTIRRSANSSANSASTRITLSKEFKNLSAEAAQRIKDGVYAYNMYGASPRQVAGSEGLERGKDATEYVDCEPTGNLKSV
jgi:hypothetical protein